MIATLDARAFIAHARPRLLADPDLETGLIADMHGDHKINGLNPVPEQLRNAIPAAVLAPIVVRPDGTSLILTERSTRLSKHSGQVAFPGGRMDPGETPVAAALREAQEEIGLDPALVTPIGFLPSYYVGTGYRIIPVVGLVDPAARLTINPQEVARVFETPLEHMLDPARHRIDSRLWQGEMRHFYVIDHHEAYIWGATAALIRVLYERLGT